MKGLLTIIILLLIFGLKTFAQPCKVIPDSLQGSYSGKCKDGLAHGKGIARGVDFYKGEFKNKEKEKRIGF